jgi:hypothetical protein
MILPSCEKTNTIPWIQKIRNIKLYHAAVKKKLNSRSDSCPAGGPISGGLVKAANLYFLDTEKSWTSRGKSIYLA